jgi:hypothetical protein
VQVRVSPVSVFEVTEIDVDGDPQRVKIQAAETAPGRYPFIYNIDALIPAE